MSQLPLLGLIVKFHLIFCSRFKEGNEPPVKESVRGSVGQG
jgi:hypothetical protein